MHELSERIRRLLDIAVWAFAGLAALSINDVAAIMTIGAGAVSIACGAVRLYDRFRPRRAGG